MPKPLSEENEEGNLFRELNLYLQLLYDSPRMITRVIISKPVLLRCVDAVCLKCYLRARDLQDWEEGSRSES